MEYRIRLKIIAVNISVVISVITGSAVWIILIFKIAGIIITDQSAAVFTGDIMIISAVRAKAYIVISAVIIVPYTVSAAVTITCFRVITALTHNMTVKGINIIIAQ